jgi:hypothetical protein
VTAWVEGRVVEVRVEGRADGERGAVRCGGDKEAKGRVQERDLR